MTKEKKRGDVMKIAVSGKGGTGKTTVSANLAKLFAQEGRKVYAVDADPDSSLGLSLGIDEKGLEKIRPLIEMEELIGEVAGDGAFYTLNPPVNDIVEQFSIDANGIRFLRMGGVKKGGTDCYCRENTFLRAVVNSLLLDTKDVVILDMGAGIEHLTRGTAQGVDLMLIITEPGKSSIQTARLVEKLAREVSVKNIRFIANKIRNEREEAFIRSNFNENELLGMIHFDEGIAEKAMGAPWTGNTTAPDNTEIEELLKYITVL